MSKSNIWVVVLAGGVGSRFWPLSTVDQPKQLLPLVTDTPLLVDAVARVRPLAPATQTLILTNASLVGAIGKMLPDLPRENLVAEPRPSGSAAALAWAALRIRERAGADAVMISVHADWAVKDEDGFRKTLARAAAAAARHHSLLTVGVVPSRPDPGFGYIQPNGEVEPGVRRVARFIEKPNRARAEAMWQEGYLWNSGIFVWRVADYLDELQRHTPEVASAIDAHGDDLAGFFAAVRPITVDVGLLERSSRVMVMPGDFGWDDIGTWGALRRVRAHDEAGNATSGNVVAVESRGNVVHAEGGTVVLYGVSDLVVVVRDGLVLVTTIDRSSDLKTLVDSLPASLRERS
ncbi:MAG TPA: sugar phosphate nucleotidyltransferase [Gemmatimonadaceae bacterium]|nr:sugar phosphate nucleotidyltransferase [Gemmatimonadaceae bacterium]